MQLGRLRSVEAVPALIDALQDESWMVRMYAARALGEIGPPAGEALPALAALLLEDDSLKI